MGWNICCTDSDNFVHETCYESKRDILKDIFSYDITYIIAFDECLYIKEV